MIGSESEVIIITTARALILNYTAAAAKEARDRAKKRSKQTRTKKKAKVKALKSKVCELSAQNEQLRKVTGIKVVNVKLQKVAVAAAEPKKDGTVKKRMKMHQLPPLMDPVAEGRRRVAVQAKLYREKQKKKFDELVQTVIKLEVENSILTSTLIRSIPKGPGVASF